MRTLTFTTRAQRALLFFCGIVALVLTMCAPFLAPAQNIDQSDTCEVLVTKVVDGDTFYCISTSNPQAGTLRDTVKVRVLNLDTFEKVRGERLDAQAQRMGITSERALLIGKMAKDVAIDLLQGKVVTLNRNNRKAPNHEKYGRLLRTVVLENGQDFSDIMKEQGFNVKR